MPPEDRYLFECEDCHLVFGSETETEPAECGLCGETTFVRITDAGAIGSSREAISDFKDDTIRNYNRAGHDEREIVSDFRELIRKI